MIHNIVKVKSTKSIKGKKGTYLSVTWQDGDKEFTKNVFEPAHQKVFKQAEESGESVDVAMEKEGDFWNVKSAEITGEEVKEQPKTNGQRFYHDRHSQDAEDWTNIRTAVMTAKDLDMHHIVSEGKVDVHRVTQNAAEIFAGMCMMKPKREEK